MTAPDKDAHSRGIGVGMVIAAAIIAEHDPVYAAEILNAANLETADKMRALGCDDYDIKKLRHVIRDISCAKRWTMRGRGYAALEAVSR